MSNEDKEKFVWAGLGFTFAFICFLVIGLLDQNHLLDPILTSLGIR